MKWLYKTKYICEVITPMFLGGAEKNMVELRTPSIKGALRFWWRALHGYLKENELRKKEKLLFGGIGDNARKSPFTIKTKLVGNGNKNQIKSFTPLPHHKSPKYNRRIFKKNAFIIGTKFEVEFIVKPFIYYEENNETKKKDGKEILKEIENIFEIFSILGGLGMRSRRGFGAFKIIKKENKDFIYSYDIDKIKEKIDLYTKNKYVIKTVKFDDLGDVNTIEIAENCNLVNTAIKQISLGWPPYNDADELTKDIGELTHDARNNKYYSENVEHRDIDNALGKAKKQERLASPIYISALECEKGLVTVITKLNSENLTDKQNLIQKKFIEGLW